MDYDIPNLVALQEVEQEILPVLTMNDPLFDLFPIDSEDAATIEWEQKDNFAGLMAVRGINGNPGRVQKVGSKTYQMEPGYYGGFYPLDEKELTKRRQLGTFDDPINIDDLITEGLEHLMTQQVNRMRKIIADVITTGTFSVVDDLTGAVQHTDSFTLPSSSASIPWTTLTTAVPLLNIRAALATRIGYSYDYGKDAIMLMNQNTYNNFVNNNNSADLAGKRASYGQTYASVGGINELLAADNLPQILVYNESYLATPSSTPTLLIPDGKVVICGKRKTGRSLGNFTITRNANNPDMAAAPYLWIVDPFQGATGNVLPSSAIPRTIEVHRGFNGGIKLPFPGGFYVLTAY